MSAPLPLALAGPQELPRRIVKETERIAKNPIPGNAKKKQNMKQTIGFTIVEISQYES